MFKAVGPSALPLDLLHTMSRCMLPASTLTNSTLAAIECSQPGSECLAICANADLAGVGVRVSFYAQSVLSALLVIISPRDSLASAWAGTLLTIALVIAAIVQKVNQTLTLHHATLIMNFATLSCISSLAVAPKLPIWNLSPNEYIARKLASKAHAEPKSMESFAGHVGYILNSEFPASARRTVKSAMIRERIALGLSLLAQVLLQWAWGVILFVSPIYSQPTCSEDTVLILFLHPFVTEDIEVAGKFAIWPIWLLSSLGVTLFLWIKLVLSSSQRAHQLLSRQTTRSSHVDNVRYAGESLATKVAAPIIQWVKSVPTKSITFWTDVLWFVLWLVYLLASELQIQRNCIFQGENDLQSIGQIMAVLLTLSPLWSLTVALYRYPALIRTHKQRQRHGMSSHAASFA